MITGETDNKVPSYNPPPYEPAQRGASEGQTPAPSVRENTPANYNGQSFRGKPTQYPSYGSAAPPPPPVPQPVPTNSSTPILHFPLPAAFTAPPGHQPSYRYYDIRSGFYVNGILPPENPHMVCLIEGRHFQKTKFGILGILAAVFWFPIGIACCLLDRRVVCQRCGLVIDHGISC